MREKKIGNTALLLSLCLALLAACAPPPPKEQRDLGLRTEMRQSPDIMRAVLSDATRFTRDPADATFHGTQVEYHAPDGKAYLWYPGNPGIVVGEWRTQADPRGVSYTQLCYRYGPNTYNPVTKRRGGSWNCLPAVFMAEDILAGNPFNLRPGRVPFIIPDKGRYAPEDFMRRLGKDPARLTRKVPRIEDATLEEIGETIFARPPRGGP